MLSSRLSFFAVLACVANVAACNTTPTPSAYAAPPPLPGAVPTYGAPPAGMPMPLQGPVGAPAPALQNVAVTTAIRPPVPLRGRVNARKIDTVTVTRVPARGQRAARPVRVPVRRDGSFAVQLPRGARYAVAFERQGRKVGVMSFPTRAGGATTHVLFIGLAVVVTPVVYDLGLVDGLAWEYVPQYSPLLWLDQDGDGQCDFYDLDDDNDGSFDDLDLDDDNDGFADALEDLDSDDDGMLDLLDPDDDNDGLPDAADPDDDGDGTADVADLDDDWGDADDDGIADELDPDDDGDGLADAIDQDDDGDGVGDAAEAQLADDDGDGIANTQDTDDDGDGVGDAQEAAEVPGADAPPDDGAYEAPGFAGGSPDDGADPGAGGGFVPDDPGVAADPGVADMGSDEQ